MPLLPSSPQGVARAAALLRAGGVVAFPTETVYGLGAIAFDRSAVARIFEIKQRPHFDPLIVHVLDRAMLGRVAARVPEAALRLMNRFWPGALTLVLGKSAVVPELVTRWARHGRRAHAVAPDRARAPRSDRGAARGTQREPVRRA